MKLARSIVVLPLVLSLWALTSRPQSTNLPSTLARSEGLISGRVLLNGKGLPDVVVKAWLQPRANAPFEGALICRTNVEGYYRFTSVPTANYYVAAYSPGLVPLQRSGSESPRAVSVSPGEKIEGVNFQLIVGGVINGRVTDSEGKPLVEEGIILTEAKPQPNPTGSFPNPEMLPFISGIFRTDDRGIYRIVGVPPGAYKVSVGTAFTVFHSFRGRPAYKQAFYPGVSDESRARVIEVTEGAVISDIDINAGSVVKTFSASGRIVDSQTGQPLSDISYDLHVAGATGGGRIPRAGSSDQKGEFRLENLPAGRYSVIISEPESEKSSEKAEFLGDSSWFEIREADVSEVEVRALKTSSISGRVVIENTQAKNVLANLPKLELLAELLPKSGGPFVYRLFRPEADGSFSVRGLKAGKLRILLNSAELGASLGLRFQRMGFDVSAPIGEIEIKNGESITGLRVVLGYGSSRVRGVVKLQNGPLPPNTRVHARVTNETGFYAGQWVDSRGNFLIDAVPPGEYTLTVTVEVPGRRTLEPEARQPISVSEGIVYDATITLDLGSIRTPVP